jgi:hypothetical protein
VAERAGLENRRWGNSSASSNLAPSAIFSLRTHRIFDLTTGPEVTMLTDW